MFPYVEQKKTENPSSQEQRGGDCSHFYTCLRQRKWGCGSCFHRHAANNRGNWDSNKVIWPSDIHIFSKKMIHLSKCVVDSEAQWSTVPGSFYLRTLHHAGLTLAIIHWVFQQWFTCASTLTSLFPSSLTKLTIPRDHPCPWPYLVSLFFTHSPTHKTLFEAFYSISPHSIQHRTWHIVDIQENLLNEDYILNMCNDNSVS